MSFCGEMLVPSEFRYDFAALACDADEKQAELERICRELLLTIGEDPDRAGLLETPRRFAKMWMEFIDYEPGKTATVFECAQADQMVIVSGMRVWSLCEHHLLPFWCDVSIGYITHEHLIGLSKLARIAHRHAHKLQVQEQLGRDIAEEVGRRTQSPDVAVLLRGEHTCMTMRGIRTTGLMTSSVVTGLFKTDVAARAEFMSLATGKV